MRVLSLLILLSFGALLVRGEVVELGDDFQQVINNNPFVFVEFYTTWCGYCKRFEPEYLKLGRDLKEEMPHVVIARVDCQKHEGICSSQNVGRYPTLKFFSEGASIQYGSENSYAGVKKFLQVRAQTLEQRAYNVTNYVYVSVKIGAKDPQRLVFALYGEQSPKSVAHFLSLISARSYEGGDFSRADPQLLVQARVSTEKPGLVKEKFAENRIPLDYGVLAFTQTGASYNDFFVSLTSAHWLDGEYDVFGVLVSGYDVLQQIANTPVETVYVQIVAIGEISGYSLSESRRSYQLAASYSRAGNLRKAYDFYNQRTTEEGWRDEIADSYYQMALISETLQTADWETLHALYRHSLAILHRPEPLYRIAIHYYLEGEHGVAFTYIDEACEIPHFANDEHPFADEGIQAVARWDVLAATAYSAQRFTLGLRAAEECVKQSPEEKRFQDYVTFYQDNLKKSEL